MRQYHLQSTPSIRKNAKRRKKKNSNVEVFQKLDRSTYQSGNKIPSYGVPAWRRDATRDIPSVPMTGAPATKHSIVDRVLRGDESEETKTEVLRKSQCVAPAYNKGAMQYVGSVEAARDVGK